MVKRKIFQKFSNRFPVKNSLFAKQKGVSFTELIVVLAVILIITTIVSVNYHEFRGSLALDRTANKIAQDIRKTLNLSISSPAPPVDGVVSSDFAGGYGIRFYEDENRYEALTHTGEELRYSAVEPANLEEKGIIISEVEVCTSHPVIFFFPPDPLVFIGDHSISDEDLREGPFSGSCEEMKITIALHGYEDNYREIRVNEAGFVEVLNN